MNSGFDQLYRELLHLREISLALLPFLLLLCGFGLYLQRAKRNGARAGKGPSLRCRSFFRPRKPQLSAVLRRERAQGILFGRKHFKRYFSPTAAEGHVCVMGGTGSGKTSALLIPTLRSWTGSSLVFDISGDIVKNVDCPNKLIYEPLAPNSIPYHIFAVVDTLNDEAAQDEALAQLALLLMPRPLNGSETSSYFVDEGRKLLTGALIALYHKGVDFTDICQTVLSNSFQSLIDLIHASKNPQASLYVNSFSGTKAQNSAGCKQACDRAITLFATNDTLARTIRRPKPGEACFSPQPIASHNVFVVIPDERLALLEPLMRVIVAQSMNFFAGRDPRDTTPILFCLDEFASFGHLDMIDALRKLRKRRIRIMILTQSLADIDLIYGPAERSAMLNNFKFKVILGIEYRDTQRYFSDLIGRERIPNEHAPTGYSEVPAVEPYELGRLDDELILLHPAGYLRLKKDYYFTRRP